MSKSKKPRKPYKGPQGRNLAAWVNCVRNSTPLGTDTSHLPFSHSAVDINEYKSKLVSAMRSVALAEPVLDVEKCFDILTLGLATLVLRVEEIEPDETKNPAVQVFGGASDAILAALNRWERDKIFGCATPEHSEAILQSLELVTEVIDNSSLHDLHRAKLKRDALTREYVQSAKEAYGTGKKSCGQVDEMVVV